MKKTKALIKLVPIKGEIRMKKALAVILLTGSFVLSSFAAYAGKSGGTLSFLVQPEPPTLASYVSTSGPIGLVMPKVYEGLFDYDNDGKMVPR